MMMMMIVMMIIMVMIMIMTGACIHSLAKVEVLVLFSGRSINQGYVTVFSLLC